MSLLEPRNLLLHKLRLSNLSSSREKNIFSQKNKKPSCHSSAEHRSRIRRTRSSTSALANLYAVTFSPVYDLLPTPLLIDTVAVPHAISTAHYAALPAGGVIVKLTAAEWLLWSTPSTILSSNPDANQLEDVDALLISQRMCMQKITVSDLKIYEDTAKL